MSSLLESEWYLNGPNTSRSETIKTSQCKHTVHFMPFRLGCLSSPMQLLEPLLFLQEKRGGEMSRGFWFLQD